MQAGNNLKVLRRMDTQEYFVDHTTECGTVWSRHPVDAARFPTEGIAAKVSETLGLPGEKMSIDEELGAFDMTFVAMELLSLLDDIDTLSDACGNDRNGFYASAYKKARERFRFYNTNGYGVWFLANEKEIEDGE